MRIPAASIRTHRTGPNRNGRRRGSVCRCPLPSVDFVRGRPGSLRSDFYVVSVPSRLPNKREGMRTGTRIPRASQERGRSAKHTGDARRGSCRVAGAIDQEFLRCRNSVKELVVDIQEKAKLRVVEHIQLAHRCGFRKRPAKDANGQVAQILEDRAVCPYSARLELDTSFVNLDRQCVVSSKGCAQRGRQRGGCRWASAPKQRSRNDRTDNAR